MVLVGWQSPGTPAPGPPATWCRGRPDQDAEGRTRVDLSYAVALVEQALVLYDRDGSQREWVTWADEAERWLRELRAS
jgi:hypothetical protein